jgi:hypothetical protein
MGETTPFAALVSAATDRPGIGALLEALGFHVSLDEVPRAAWREYGLGPDPDLRALVVAGQAGSLDALLLEVTTRCPPERVHALAASVRARNPARLHLFLFSAPGTLILGTFGAEGDLRHLTLEPGRVRHSDLDALDEMAPRHGEAGLALALRQARALDRARVTGKFFRDFRAHRSAVASALMGLPEDALRDRSQLALLFLCRLTFLYFLQRRGTLCGDDRYLVRLFAGWRGSGTPTFFRRRLLPLFFGALNRPAEDRSPAARALGPLPYLNGGLFEPHALERAHPRLDLPDPVVGAVLEGLLERYRFASREAAEGSGFGVDPEVLGQVFEGLMAPRERLETGSFYTPAPVVQRVVREALGDYLQRACPGIDAAALMDGDVRGTPPETRTAARGALERVRVLDPACGSGAFLLGALHYLAQARAALSATPTAVVRRDVVARSLHGVDLLDDAALLCSLRLWLALSDADEVVSPLPNLDGRIRQGDALMEPLDLALGSASPGTSRDIPLSDPALRCAYRAVGPAARRYLDSSPATRSRARKDLAKAERELARHWLERAGRRQHETLRALRATAAERDLFDQVPACAVRARSALREAEQQAAEIASALRQLDQKGALPFFSFGVHFADTGGVFDFIVSNPPWVRAHRWPARLRRLAARHYEVCRGDGRSPSPGVPGRRAATGAQIDLSLLFLERSCRLLAPGGVLAILLPAKVLRALYGANARRMLLRDLEFAVIEDHSLDQRSIFRADAFPVILILRRPLRSHPLRAPGGGAQLRIRMVRRGVPPLEFSTLPHDLPLHQHDPASPWLIAPPDVVRALRVMQRSGRPLGEHSGLRVRRGVMTGANEVLVMSRAELKLGGLSRIEAIGYAIARRKGRSARMAARYRGYVETSGLRPLVRGADLDRFRYQAGSHVIWCHDAEGRAVQPSPRLQRYLQRHRDRLEARTGWKAGCPLGSLFRISADTLMPKVAWHDLSDQVRAVALPARVRLDGTPRELVPLNTVYFIPMREERHALILAAILNSLPLGAFARAVAERAKDARFRFFAWTVASLPLPEDWNTHPASMELLAISQRAHARGGIDADEQRRIDLAVAALYRLPEAALDSLVQFDRWLQGIP